MQKRVLITGAGVVSAIGFGQEQSLEALRQGLSGVERVRFLPTEHTEFPVGEVKLSNEMLCRQLNIPYTKRESRTELMGMLALKEALLQARLIDEAGTPAVQGLALLGGTTVAGMDRTEAFYPDRLDADILNRHDCGASTNAIADYFGCFDLATTVSTACSAALNAIIMGARMIESGLRDIVVVGGSESLSRFHLNGFKSLMILDEQRCRPFDATRAGLNLGEGAAFIVLESEDSALRRHADILGELLGTGNACDAFHQTASSDDGEGAFLAIRQALDEARLQPSDIQYVNAHGTGTPNNDASESQALCRVFGKTLPAVSSTKMLTGHTTSASGAIEAVFCLLALRHQFAPANIGWQTADPQCVVPYTGGPLPKLENVLCNAFGFGGNDSAIILSRYGE